ncbi:MAG: hypothetical protein ACRDPW_10375, partial [Mycobacteriales bacterium]
EFTAVAARQVEDETAEVPMWHGPEFGRTMRFPIAANVAAAAQPETDLRAPRQGGVRRRLVPLAVAAAVLAIPLWS